MRLNLFYPIKPWIVGQGFGLSLACIENTPDVPITKRKVVAKINGVCPVGYIELYPLLGMKGHPGVDVIAYSGQPVYASIDGKVQEIQTEPERGLGVGIVSHNRYEMDEYGEHYVKVRDWHFKGINVSLGQEVNAGDLIGWADNTGLSAGDHLHNELKPVEFNADGSYYNVFQSNGYFGAIDSEPFRNKFYAQDAQIVIGILRAMVEVLTKLVGLFKK